MGESTRISSVSSGWLALMLIALSVVSCGNDVPSAELAHQVLRSSIDDGSDARLQVISFQKTDGRTRNVMGMDAYELMFDGEAEFISNAMFSGGSPLMSQGSELTTGEYRSPSPGFSWNDFFAGSQGFQPAMKGDRLHLTGTVTFERRESGWAPAGIRFVFKHDTTTRDMEAMRIEDERRQAEEVERPTQPRLPSLKRSGSVNPP